MNLRNWIRNLIDAPRRRDSVRQLAAIRQHVVKQNEGFLRVRADEARLDGQIRWFEKEGATPQQVLGCLNSLGDLAQSVKLLNMGGTFNFEIQPALKLGRTPENDAFKNRVALSAQKLKGRAENLLAEVSRYNDTGGLKLDPLLSRIMALRTWHKMTGVEFENYIINRLRGQGFTAQATKASGDEGIDIVAVFEGDHAEPDCLIGSPVRGGKYLIQCKRYEKEHGIGQPTLREFYGSMKGTDPSAEGIFITTSYFSDPAISYAQKMGISLIDGKTLDALLSSKG